MGEGATDAPAPGKRLVADPRVQNVTHPRETGKQGQEEVMPKAKTSATFSKVAGREAYGPSRTEPSVPERFWTLQQRS